MRTLNAIVCLSLCNLIAACSEDPASTPLGGGGAGSETGGAGSGGMEAMGGEASGGAEAGGAEPMGSPVKVTVRDYDGATVAGVDVIANDMTGALIDQAVTDGTGLAEIVVPAGGSLSVLHENDYGWSTPGALDRSVETILFADTPPEAVSLNILVVSEPVPGPTMTLDMWYSPRSGATSYELVTSCGSKTSASMAMELTQSNCTANGVFDAVLVARGAGGSIVDHARLDDLPFVGGAFQSHLMTWKGVPQAQIPFAVSSVPEGGGVSASSSAREREPGGAAQITSAHPFENASGVVAFTLPHIPGYGSEHCQSATIYLTSAQSNTRTYSRQRCSAVADLSTFGINPKRLTHFDPTTQETEPHTLRWEAGETADVGDVLVAQQLWYRSEDVTGSWSVYLAPSVRDVSFPELPQGLEAFALEASDVLAFATTVHQDFEDIDGFDAALASGLPELREVSDERYRSTLAQ